MKKLLVTVCVAVMAVALWSCGNPSPSAVVEKAMTCLQKGDYEGWISYYDMENKEKEQFVAMLREMDRIYLKEEGKSFKDVFKKEGLIKVVSEEISEDGNTAKVKLNSEKNGGIKLVKAENGEWKISMGREGFRYIYQANKMLQLYYNLKKKHL